ncbi:hypothetical protein HB779_06200 [Phyllobacterium sp. 628]|nr:hypothetical protein [Phyllobacterium sp. 628]QND51537.1 hypothetical protein HB779_06200 [Phyllobacterium sp. 628]
MTTKRSAVIPRKISSFCQVRIAHCLQPTEVEALRLYLLRIYSEEELPPRIGAGINWYIVGKLCNIAPEYLIHYSKDIRPIFDLLIRELKRRPKSSKETSRTGELAANPPVNKPRRPLKSAVSPIIVETWDYEFSPRNKPGKKAQPIIEFPEALWTDWQDQDTLHDALRLHMDRHGDTVWQLSRAVVKSKETFSLTTLKSWLSAKKAPRSLDSMRILERIERRYRLPSGYFKAKIPHPSRGAYGHQVVDILPSERRRLAWHLPDDFESRSAHEQEEILSWVRKVIVTGSTDYRRYQAVASKQHYAIRFSNIHDRRPTLGAINDGLISEIGDPDLASSVRVAPIHLQAEMKELLRFKTSTLATFGYQRNGLWGNETADQKIEHLGLMFGALAASPQCAVRGLGVPVKSLTFALLVFPSVWDWYLQWREQRRGFYTAWEVDMLRVALAFTRHDTGWIRQTPSLSKALRPIEGVVSIDEIQTVRANWDAACDICHKHCTGRVKEINKVARVHRDPFEPILPILEAPSPVGEYRKITDEIIRLLPDEKRYPRSAAESIRSFLMIRLGRVDKEGFQIT